MQNQYQIYFYSNVNGVTVGTLKHNKKMLLATTHPATIAYALQALGAESVEFTHESTQYEMALPCNHVDSNFLEELGEHANWVIGFTTFSQIDSFAPPAFDSQADLHLRTAVHFLPKMLTIRKPTSKKPENWLKELKIRKAFIYYPYC